MSVEDPSKIVKLLPPNLESLCHPVAAIFIGTHQPSQEWLMKKARPLCIRPDRVRAALEWLLSSGYDLSATTPFASTSVNEGGSSEFPAHRSSPMGSSESDCDDATPTLPIEFAKTVITNITNFDTVARKKDAASRHVKDEGGSFLQLPHADLPVNEFNNPSLFPMTYPTLFPFGLGGFEEHNRSHQLSFVRQSSIYSNDEKYFARLASNLNVPPSTSLPPNTPTFLH